MQLPMSQEAMMEVIKKLAEDKEPVSISFGMFDLFMLIAQLQLVARHPELSKHQLDFANKMGKQFQKAITSLHPEADEVIEMGWNTRFDVDKTGDFVNPHAAKEVHNVFALYSDDEGGDSLLGLGSRPQDWGDPKWKYKTIQTEMSIDGQAYRYTAHFWFTENYTDGEFMQQGWVQQMVFSPYLPGADKELCGRDYLEEEDFWQDEWGKMPPFYEGEDDDF
jgi:hypothetical protein